jgi:competence protein ComEC
VIDFDRLRKQGAMALRKSRSGFVIEANKPRGLDRPWSPAVADNTETEILARPATGKGVDATPSEADIQSED